MTITISYKKNLTDPVEVNPRLGYTVYAHVERRRGRWFDVGHTGYGQVLDSLARAVGSIPPLG
jgi:hypothetical protein